MANPVIDGKRADSARRRERVLKAIDAAVKSGGDITISGLAPHGSSRPDIPLPPSQPARTRPRRCQRTHGRWADGGGVPDVQTNLANALEANKRLTARVRQLERRLACQLGTGSAPEQGCRPSVYPGCAPHSAFGAHDLPRSVEAAARRS